MGLYTMTVLGLSPVGEADFVRNGRLDRRLRTCTVAIGGGVRASWSRVALQFASQRPTLRRVIRPIYEKPACCRRSLRQFKPPPTSGKPAKPRTEFRMSHHCNCDSTSYELMTSAPSLKPVASSLDLMNEHDLIVIGSGPGGYTAPIPGSQLGLNVGLRRARQQFEAHACESAAFRARQHDPESSERFHEAHAMAIKEHGVRIRRRRNSIWPRFCKRKKSRSSPRSAKGIDGLLKKIQKNHPLYRTWAFGRPRAE